MTPTKAYAIKDYVFASLFALSPFLFGFNTNDARKWVPIALGGGAIAYSLVTDYELSATRLLSFPWHVAIDGAAGLLLALSPWIFGFADEVKWPHLIMGLLEIGVVTATTIAGARQLRGEKKVWLNPALHN